MAKLIVQWNPEDCYINGPDLKSSYNYSEETNSFLTDSGEVDDESIIMVNKFIKSYKSLHKDIHNIFEVSGTYGSELMLSPDCFECELLLPEEREDVFAKFFASDLENKRGPGFGCEPFPEDFYKDFFNIFQNYEGYIAGTLSGNFEGYYKFEVELKPNGILWETIHYEEDW